MNPNNESYYLPHPNGGYVQFENLVGDTLQDGKLVTSPTFAGGGGMMDILIAEDQLPVSDALLTRLAEKVPAVRWRELDDDVRQAYARHVALLDAELRPELGVSDLAEPMAFYNAYFWALVFAKRYQARYGFDAGIEQEAFKVLERAPADVDWQVVERVNQVAQQAG